MIDSSIKEREKANETHHRLLKFVSFLRIVGGGSSDNAFLTIDFSSGRNIEIVNGSGGAAGLAQKLDNTFQSFPGGVLRKTDRGLLVEPASQNFIAPSDLQNAAYALSGSFTAINAKIPLIPGGTAWEYVANATAANKNRTGIGTFSAGREFLSVLVETTPTSNRMYVSIVDVTNGNAQAIVLEVTAFATTPVISFGLGNATSQLFGHVNLGPGPNGGTLYLFVMSGIPTVAGNTCRSFVYPNGASSVVSGSSVIIHHVQYEQGQSTSPILNPSTVALSRAADVITVTVPSGTYDIRHHTQDGVLNNDKLGTVIAGNLLTLPTDVTEKTGPIIFTAASTPPPILRNGHITSIAIWNQSAVNIHVLGDSFPTLGALTAYLPSKLYRPKNWTFDGVGSTSLAQEAARFDLTPQYYGDILIIVDGGLDDTLAASITAIDSMVAHLTTNPKKWLYIQSSPNATYPLGNPTHTTWLTTDAGIKAAYPNNYVDTKAIMQSHGDGSANDISDIANDWWPRSLRSDTIHPNALGCMHLAQIIANAIQLNRF